MFIFSPFGLRCGECSKGAMIQFDKRSIQIHLKKHGMDDRVATVRSFFNLLKIQLDSAKALGTIEPYRSDRETYIGYLCICGQVFQSRKTVHFDIAKMWFVTVQNSKMLSSSSSAVVDTCPSHRLLHFSMNNNTALRGNFASVLLLLSVSKIFFVQFPLFLPFENFSLSLHLVYAAAAVTRVQQFSWMRDLSRHLGLKTAFWHPFKPAGTSPKDLCLMTFWTNKLFQVYCFSTSMPSTICSPSILNIWSHGKMSWTRLSLMRFIQFFLSWAFVTSIKCIQDYRYWVFLSCI